MSPSERLSIFVKVMSRTYTISPDPFLVVIKDEEGNAYSCNHMDMIELEGYSVHVPGIYDWYLYFNTYAEYNPHRCRLL